MTELLMELERNAGFYEREAEYLAADPARRDRRNLGAEEAKTIAGLLKRAADALRAA